MEIRFTTTTPVYVGDVVQMSESDQKYKVVESVVHPPWMFNVVAVPIVSGVYDCERV